MKKKALRCLLGILGLSLLGAQDQAKPLNFKFAEAPLDAVLQFTSEATGFVFINEANFQGKITAVSDTPVAQERVLDFLNGILTPKGYTTMRLTDRVVRIVTLEEAKKKNVEIHHGSDPSKVPAGDRVITQIIPLKSLTVLDFDTGLKALVPETARIAKDPANNTLIAIDTADSIKRFLEFVSRLDGPSATLRYEVIELKNAEPGNLSQVLQSFVQKDQGAQGAGTPSKMVKIIPDPRSNSIVVTATEENIKLVKQLVINLDQTTGSIVQIKNYPIKGASAVEVASTLTTVLKADSGPAIARIRGWQWYDPKQVSDTASIFPVKAFADAKANSVIVTATEPQLDLIDKVIAALDFERSLNVYALRFATAKDLVSLLKELTQNVSPPITIQADARINTMFVRATEEQLKEINLIVSEVDRQIQETVKIKPFALKNAEPAEVQEVLAAVFRSEKGVSQTVEVIPNKRTGTLLIKAPNEYFTLIDELVQSLDAVPRDEEVTYVARLKSASAKSVAQILTGLSKGEVTADVAGGLPAVSAKPVGGSSSPRGASSSPAMPSPPAPNATPSFDNSGAPKRLGPDQEERTPAPAKRVAGSSSTASPVDISGIVKVQTDDASNTIVVRTSKRNMPGIQNLIKELDKYPPQVLIKVLIAEVTLADEVQFGVEGFWEDTIRLAGGDSATQKIQTILGAGTSGFSYLLTASRFNIGLRALAQKGLLKVLATPQILVQDNNTADVTVGKRVPFITSTSQTPFGGISNAVSYADTGIILRVIPKINPDGIVTLNIHPEVSDVASQTEGVVVAPGAISPTFIKTSADTTVTVKDGQTIILGGLIRELEDTSKTQVPILGDIPLIGSLFSRTGTTKNRRELMIFLTPRVVYSQAELEELTTIERAKLKLIDTRMLGQQEVKRWLKDLER